MNTTQTERFHMIVTADLTPRGDGTFVLKPGKPQQWLWASEAAKHCRVSPHTVVRWWHLGYVKGRRVGLRKVQIDADSLMEFTHNEPEPSRAQYVGTM